MLACLNDCLKLPLACLAPVVGRDRPYRRHSACSRGDRDRRARQVRHICRTASRDRQEVRGQLTAVQAEPLSRLLVKKVLEICDNATTQSYILNFSSPRNTVATCIGRAQNAVRLLRMKHSSTLDSVVLRRLVLLCPWGLEFGVSGSSLGFGDSGSNSGFGVSGSNLEFGVSGSSLGFGEFGLRM